MSKNTKAVSEKSLLQTYFANCEPVSGQNIVNKRIVDEDGKAIGYPEMQLKEGVTKESIAEQLGMEIPSFSTRSSTVRSKFQLQTTVVSHKGKDITVQEYCKATGKTLDEVKDSLETMTVVYPGIELPKFRGKSAESFDVDGALDDLLADVD